MSPVEDRGHLVDRATQAWVRATGRRVLLAEHPWLDGPVGGPRVIGDAWLAREARRLDGELVEGTGLVGQFDRLSGEGFDTRGLATAVVDFYEQTADWRLDVWSQWSAVAWPFGRLLSAVFARRLQQLNLPLRPLEVAKGMDSRVVSVVDGEGLPLGSAWFRTLRSTGQAVYSGWYGLATLPAATRPSIRVVFPLPNGSVTVFLLPSLEGNGALRLTSPLGHFGQDGAYLVVATADRRHAWVRRVPLAERFDVYIDDEGVLRTDHALDLWRIPVIRLHYRLQAPPGQWHPATAGP